MDPGASQPGTASYGVDEAFLGKKKKLIGGAQSGRHLPAGLRMRLTQSISRSLQNVAYLALKRAVADD
jgi:hypothetical protein